MCAVVEGGWVVGSTPCSPSYSDSGVVTVLTRHGTYMTSTLQMTVYVMKRTGSFRGTSMYWQSGQLHALACCCHSYSCYVPALSPALSQQPYHPETQISGLPRFWLCFPDPSPQDESIRSLMGELCQVPTLLPTQTFMTLVQSSVSAHQTRLRKDVRNQLGASIADAMGGTMQVVSPNRKRTSTS